MRRPRDFDAELKALSDKAKTLKDRRVKQLGELVLATGADTLDADILAGVLIDAVQTGDQAVTEGWRRRGAEWFLGKGRGAADGPRTDPQGAPALDGGASPDRSGKGQD